MTSPEIIIQRSNCFKLLAACFYEPDKKMFLEENVLQNLSKLLTFCDPELGESGEDLKKSFEKSSEEQLKVDHAALFIGPFELLAAPYGSIYLEAGNRVLGESTLAVQKYYEEAGLSTDIQEPADHIAIELEFLHYLAVQEAEAISLDREQKASNMRTIQSHFLSRFMGWVPEFCERIERGALTDYYKSLGLCLASFYRYCKNEYSAVPIEH